MTPLAIRADANATIGAGHVMRCLALAEAWRRAGGETLLFAAALPPFVRTAAERYGLVVRSFDSTAAAWTALVAWTRSVTDAWVVFDNYDLDHDAQRAIRAAGARLLVIDDFAADRRFHCDVLLNQNVGAESVGYRVDAGTRCCFGPRFALVRSEFTSLARPRSLQAVASRLLVTFGGADVHNQAARIAAILAGSTPPLEATVVSGQTHAAANEASTDRGVRIWRHAPTDNMATLMAEADMAICAAGSTCWELACLGVPALTLIVADNQARVAEGLHGLGVVRNLGWFDAVSDADIAAAIELLRRDAARVEMSRRGRELVDGRGADRVVNAMRLTTVEA
jgi:UDP-2,4-diacetamido-2,4,6-trideoxy-beta-L-altropyranose hydrolase